jgi:hypothetical protein
LRESPEVEWSTQSPRGKTNIEHGAEPSVDKTDPTGPVRVSNPKQMPLGNLENARQTGTTPEVSILPSSIFCSDPPKKWNINISLLYVLEDSSVEVP